MDASNSSSICICLPQLTTTYFYISRLARAILYCPVDTLRDGVYYLYDCPVEVPPAIQIMIGLTVAYLIHKVYTHIHTAFNTYQDANRGAGPGSVIEFWQGVWLRAIANIEVLEPPRFSPKEKVSRGLLNPFSLSKRQGPRPTVNTIGPHSQINHRAPLTIFNDTIQLFENYALSHLGRLTLEDSFFEPHQLALKSTNQGRVGVPNTCGEFGYEICHTHNSDGSLHMVLHPEDIATVIEAGWGERHPLSTKAWYWRFWYHTIRRRHLPVPEYMILVYAPRTPCEFQVFSELIQAAVWYNQGGRDLRPKTNTGSNNCQAENAPVCG